MKQHSITIKTSQEKERVITAECVIEGDPHEISKALCGLLKNDEAVRGIFIEALFNALGQNMTILDHIHIDQEKGGATN